VTSDADPVGGGISSNVRERGGGIHGYKLTPTCRNGKRRCRTQNSVWKPYPQESRDAHALMIERHRAGSMIVTSNRGPDEWLATFADPVRAQGAIDRLTSNASDLIIEGESYRDRLKPGRKAGQRAEKKAK
jgi:hypothetical protein